jgi:hypothetical protein
MQDISELLLDQMVQFRGIVTGFDRLIETSEKLCVSEPQPAAATVENTEIVSQHLTAMKTLSDSMGKYAALLEKTSDLFSSYRWASLTTPESVKSLNSIDLKKRVRRTKQKKKKDTSDNIIE